MRSFWHPCVLPQLRLLQTLTGLQRVQHGPPREHSSPQDRLVTLPTTLLHDREPLSRPAPLAWTFRCTGVRWKSTLAVALPTARSTWQLLASTTKTTTDRCQPPLVRADKSALSVGRGAQQTKRCHKTPGLGSQQHGKALAALKHQHRPAHTTSCHCSLHAGNAATVTSPHIAPGH